MALTETVYEVGDENRPSPLTWAHSQSLSIVILRPGAIAEPRWAAFVRSFEQAKTSRLLLLVVGDVDLAWAHRRALTQAIGERRVAAVVEGAVGRELLTALEWAGVELERFPSSRIREALASLDPESEGEPIEQCLDLAARLIEGISPGPRRNNQPLALRPRWSLAGLRGP